MTFALPLRPGPVGGLRLAPPRSPFALAVLSAAHFLSRIGARARSRGDGRASRFDDVVLGHLDSAYSLARYLARDGDAAEDIVQTAVLEAVRGFAGYRGGDAKAWLLTIVRREYMRWSAGARSRAAGVENVDISELGERIPADTPTPEQALLCLSDVERIRTAIGALPEPFRESIVLRELEEMSYREVAQITGVPIGTVMSRLARGREMLARQLLGAEQRTEVAS
jgi:RNA polymerase sigma-70 factor (ECF subfamily)